MRNLAVIAGILIVAAVAFVVLTQPSAAQRKKASETSAEMRRRVLSREIFKGTPTVASGAIRAVVVDWRVGSGVATVVAYEDGTTSLLFSTGGGIIGAGSREPVRRAAEAMRSEAAKVASGFAPVSDFPLPPDGHSRFYVVTDTATLASAPVPTSDLAASTHALNALEQRAQDVITEIRKAS